jgi:hypothetical protein
MYDESIVDSSVINQDPKMPVVEPVLPILDEYSREIVINACYDYIRDENGKVKMNDNKPQIYLKYSDILLLASTGVGHLESLSHYTWEQGMSILLAWEGYNLDPLIDKYHRHPDQLKAIYAIKHCMTRQIVGGSIEGAHQDFLSRYVGADRRVSIRREREERR